ncbi:MAG TPA: DMT family transporter [Firmicutes bacterium]|nr:DMT family transporter [Bacillota bacterium]
MGGFNLIALIVVLLSGLAMAVQGSLNSILSKITGLLEATMIVHIIGLSLLLVLYLLKFGKGSILNITSAPWYTLLGGVLGVIIIYGVMYGIPKLGVAVATTGIIVGQVATALLIDHFGLFGLEKIPFSWTKGIGLILLALGARLMLMK